MDFVVVCKPNYLPRNKGITEILVQFCVRPSVLPSSIEFWSWSFLDSRFLSQEQAKVADLDGTGNPTKA